MAFIAHYVGGWSILMPIFVALGWLAVYQARRDSAWWAPQLMLLWLAACITVYVISGVGRYLGHAEPRWLFMVLTILLATALPAAIVIGVARVRRLRTRGLAEHVGIVTLTAILVIPLAVYVSDLLFRIFHAVEATT